MSLFKRKSNEPKSSAKSDGPEEWARIARERDAELLKQRAAEAAGNTAVDSAHNINPDSVSSHEIHNSFSDVEELSEAFLRYLDSVGVDRGKFIRLGDSIFISPGKRPGHEDYGLTHKEIIERALKKPEVKERTLGAEALEAALSTAHVGEHGLSDAGRFDIFFLKDGEQKDDGTQGRFRIFGASGDYGMAEKKAREETVRLAIERLGPHIRAEYAPHMDLSR